MRKVFLLTGISFWISLVLLGQNQNPPEPCNTFGPQNNPVFTFDNQKLVFDNQGGANGFMVMNQSVTVPTYVAANGVYDENGEIIFVVTYESIPNHSQHANLVGFNKFGQKFYLYRKSIFGFDINQNPLAFNPIPVFWQTCGNKLQIFQAPGKCDEYYVIHGTELIPGNSGDTHVALTKIRFTTFDYSLIQLTSLALSEFFVDETKNITVVSALRKDNNPGTSSEPNPLFNKLFRNIYSFGRNQFGVNNYYQFLATKRIYEDVDYYDGSPSDMLVTEYPKIQFLGQSISPYIFLGDCSMPNQPCPPFLLDDAIQVSQTQTSSKFLLVGKRGKIMAGAVTPLDYESPIWLFEEKYENQTITYHLTSCSNQIDRISGVAILDGDQTDNKIDYVFYSQERSDEQNIRIHKDVDLNWFKIGHPAHSTLAFDNTSNQVSGIVQGSNQAGNRSALEISYGQKYLIYPLVPASGTSSLGLMELSSLLNLSNLNNNQVYSVPQISSFYTDFWGQHGTNTQLFRQKYVGSENSMLPSCVPDISFENVTTTLGISPLSNASNWIKAFGTSKVEATKSANFLAGQYVQLLPSFHAEANSSFRAAIQPCPYLGTCCQAAIPVYYPLYSGGRRAVASVGKENHGEPTFTIQPNPSNGQFTVQFQEKLASGKVLVRDLALREISRSIGELKDPLSFSGMAPGVYLLTVETEDYVETQRVVVH